MLSRPRSGIVGGALWTPYTANSELQYFCCFFFVLLPCTLSVFACCRNPPRTPIHFADACSCLRATHRMLLLLPTACRSCVRATLSTS